jgi:hypothetical protein
VLREARQHAASRGRYQREPPLVVVNVLWPMLGLALHQLPLAAEVLKHLTFSPRLRQLAVQIAQRIPAAAGAARKLSQRQGAGEPPPAHVGAYNGLHLRLERDATEWQNVIGGPNRWACGARRQAAPAAGCSGGPASPAP